MDTIISTRVRGLSCVANLESKHIQDTKASVAATVADNASLAASTCDAIHGEIDLAVTGIMSC